VELATALAFGVSGYVLTLAGRLDGVTVGFWAVMLMMLIVLAVYDKRWMILPDKVMMPLLVVAFAYDLVAASLAHSPQLLAGYLAAACVAGGFFYAIVFFSKGRGMGGGDIKLAFVMGLILGPANTAVAMLLAFNVAAIVGVAMIIIRKRKRRDQIPFGPFLVGGTVVAYLYGEELVDWYLRLSGIV
jgi:prepilin signal peptidase PulO-like enzyme (type II secretory pathway)